MIVFDISTLTIRGDLKYLLRNSPKRIILVWAAPNYASLILQNALDSDVIGPQFIWILTSNVPLNSFNQTLYNKLIGMLTVEPVVGNVVNASINRTLLDAAYTIWKQHEPESFPGSNNVDPYALFAFDATWILIQALKKLCSKMINNSTSCLSFTNTSSCFDRRFLNSNSFFDIINNSSFLGISGSVQFSPNVTDRINGTYYITKNVQHSSNGLNYISVLLWSESHGWTSHTQTNVIIWPGDTLERPSEYAAVSGITLRIAIIEVPPFTMVKEITDDFGKKTTTFIGYLPDLIKILETKMGFKPNIILVPSNQSYNGLIDAVADDVYDMVVADVTITAVRLKKVAFSSSIFDNSLRIIVREASIDDVDFLSYLRPFSSKLWITLSIATIFAGFLICLLERQENEALRNRSILSMIAMSMWYSIGTILGYGADFHVRTAVGRLLSVGLYVLSLVLVAAYTAKLASDLTISKTKGIISGLDDIKNGKLSFSRIGILTNSSIEDYYLREISRDNRNFHPIKTDQEIYDKLLNNVIDAAIQDSGVLEYATNNIYCSLTLVGTDFEKNALGIVFKKKWLYQQAFDENILALRESGTLDELKRKWFQTNYCSRSSSSSTFTPMTIETMAGLFITFGVISILVILLFAWKTRFIIKDYLLKLTHRKDLPDQSTKKF
jgi:ABC-type amino acid transport substrate-binding protein